MSFYRFELSQQEQKHLNIVIFENIEKIAQHPYCVIWKKHFDKYDYPIINLKFRHKLYTLKIHRLVYFLAFRTKLVSNVHVESFMPQ